MRAASSGGPTSANPACSTNFWAVIAPSFRPFPALRATPSKKPPTCAVIPVVFIDTAGLREATDEIEVEGIRRSRGVLAWAELILHVLDGSEPLSNGDEKLWEEFAGKKRILICNKADLPQRLQLPAGLHAISLSCATGKGLEDLKDAIQEMLCAGGIHAEMLQVMVNSRHEDALRRARSAATRAEEALRQGAGLELVALDLRQAANAVGEIVGKTTTEDLLDSIFSQFCIGK